jgi:predicted transcriptional regulator of viral defense system
MDTDGGRRWSRERVVSDLTEAGLDFFTADDLTLRLGLSESQARKTLERMVDANQARRLQRGLYALVHPADWNRPTAGYAANWYLTAARLVAPHPYFIAYYSAMEIHSMLQHPLLTVFVATTVQKKQVVLSPMRVRFVTLRPSRFFGFEEKEVEPGRDVLVATLERTFVDGASRPALCGGLEQVLAGYRRRLDDLDPARLLDVLNRLAEPTITKRVGFLLGYAGLSDPALFEELEHLAGRLGRYIPLVPGAVRTSGTWRDKRWELEVNVPRDQLQRMSAS